MLKLYFLQQWYNLGDREVEEFVADSKAFRDFTGLEMVPLDNGDFLLIVQKKLQLYLIKQCYTLG